MPNSSSSPRPSPLSHDNAPVTATATDTATPRRMFFEGPIPPPLGKAVDREGIKRATPNKPAIIPTNTPTFKFTAGFSKCKTGYYVVRWRVKLLDGFSIPNGLRFSVSVSYSAEQDIKSSMDVVMLPEDLKDQPKNRSYDLELEELAVIHPHEGDATVEVIMASRESRVNHQYSGFQVESVEFKLFTGSSESQPTAATGDAIKKLIVKRATEPSCNIDGSTIDCSMIGTQGPPFTPPITRLAWSEDSTFLAALSLWKDIACITVWDMSHIRNPKDTSNLQWHRAKAIVRNENGKEFDNLSIGLAISPKGDQVAIYHQPRIGEWKSGTKVEKCLFQFSLLNNPLVHHSTRTDSIVHMNEEPKRSELERLSLPHLVLKNFTGYGAFLMEKEERNWETFDTNNALSSSVGKCTPGRTPSSARTLFAACNGLDLDVFKIGHSDLKWTHIHSITITDLTPMLNRRITCKMMMEMITSNRFMWLESGGLCCTVWDLQKGSNVSYISSIDKTKFSGLTFRGNTRMAISPDQSLAALTSADGILTTYYTNTGIAIDRKEFTGHKIEYVGFHNHSYQLFVIIRDNISLELTSWILDPLQLESKMAAKEVPIPNIGKTIHTFFRKGYFQNKGLVCEAYGSKVHCYVSYEHPAFNVQIHDGTKVRTTEAVYQVQGKRYSVRPKTHREQVGDGNGSMYWVLSVQVFENDHPEPIFSFVPEPWMRVSTRDVPLTDDLLKAYFLPGGPRFVVTGVQSVQIWELPTEKNNSCSLEFIWSRPMLEVKEGRKYKREPVGNHYQDFDNASIHVDSATGDAVAVVQMEGGRKTHVNIPSTRGSYPQAIFLSCARSIHLLAASYMFASQKNGTMVDEPAQDKYAKAILRFTQGHINRLLSASDYYPHSGEPVRGDGAARVSLSERKDTPGQGNYDTMTPPQSPMQANFRNAGYLPQLEDFGISTSANDAKAKSKWNKDPGWTAVDTVLTLLLKPKELKDANHTFIEKILNTDDGAWVPHANKDLNLIARAIELKNEQLLKTLIDYCIKKAENHPLYLVPVDQCLSELLVPYPDMVAEIFRRASYIPAPNHAYVAIGASRSFLDLVHYRTRSNPLYGVFGKISWKTPKIEDCQSPVFALRSQLPISPSLLRGVNSISRQFPTNQDEEPDKIPYGTIYVCPFQFLPTPRSFRGFFDRRLQKESVFAQMAGKDFFDSPAVAVSLRFKWRKFGRKYWFIRFAAVLILFILVLIVTAKQIQVSTLRTHKHTADENASPFEEHWARNDTLYQPTPEEFARYPPECIGKTTAVLLEGHSASNGTFRFYEPTPKEIAARYLPEWRPVFFFTMAWGIMMILYELLQLVESPWRYVSSLYNYVDLAAFVSPVAGCILFLKEKPEIQRDTCVDGGPSQVWIMSYAILFLYLNILFELRVFRQLGFAVNIIFNITRRIKWFFMIFGIFLVCFTHALLYILHTRRYRPCEGNSCANIDYPDFYPTDFPGALSATYFFLSGRYEPIDSSLKLGGLTFHMMMVIFYFFTAIVLLNVLIALMNDAFSKSDKEGDIAHLRILSEVIAEMETHAMSNATRRKSDFYPRYIYYCASNDEVAQFRAKCSMVGGGTHDTLTSAVNTLMESLKIEQDSRVANYKELKQEIHARGEDQEAERARSHEKLKQEMDELKATINRLLLALDSQNIPPHRPDSGEAS